MGYYTRYTLKADPWPEGLSEAIEDDSEGLGWALEPDGSMQDSVTWYEHEKDMRRLSTEFPGVLFTLHGEGEEAGDLWDKHFRDGRMQVCKAQIVIPPFDERKLE